MEDIELAIHGDTIISRNSADSYFRANFGGGSYIKGLIAHLASVTSQGTFTFTKTYIRLVTCALDNQVAMFLDLDTMNFPYEYTGEEPVIVTISLKDLSNALSSISKSSGVILEKEVGKDILNVIPTDSVSSIPLHSRSTIKFTREEPDKIGSFEYPRSPACSIKTNAFSKMFNTFAKNKTSRVECYGSKSGIKFAGNNNLATNKIEQVFGHFDKDDETVYNMLAIRPDVAKTLTKLTALNNDGEVRVFYSELNPCRFVVPISNYGTLDIYISDMRTEDAIQEEIELSEVDN